MRVRAALAIAGLAAFLVPAAALAADGAEQQLAEKYAPVVGLKQHEPCAGTGEPYRPVPVETVLAHSDVVLLGPDGKVAKQAPTAADLYGKGDGYWLDFPGDPLHAGCSYEEWFNGIAAGKATTAYAHVVEEQGQLALQYWFFYPFNDWNNKHESDWEMIQVVFDAPTAEEALSQTPELVGYSQHEGAESANWDDEKLEKRGVHPVVYPGAGSHANQGQWTKPITWVDEEWRSDSVQVPASDSVAPTATGFFCMAVEKGSEIYIRFLRNPFVVLGSLGAIAMFAVWLSRRTNWSPALPTPIRQRRDVGEIYRSGFRVYRSRPALFIGIGLMAIPLGALAAIAQNLLFGVTGLSALTDVAVEDPVVGAFSAVLLGAFTTVIAAVLVYAACAEALDRIDEGEQPDALDAYRGILPALLPLAWATLRMTIVAVLLVVTVIGIPIAIVYLIRKAITVQSIVIEERGATSGLRRSGELVRGDELRVIAIAALVNGTVALLGPIIGVAMMFVTPASLALINLVSSIVYVFVLPAAGIAIALLFFDLRIRKESLQTSPATAGAEPERRPHTSGETGPSTAPQGA